MGIHGLWKLLEPAGKDVTLESLENKVLAIDVSLWLHQAQQGTSHAGGGNGPNAHLLTLFHRISKLLFYRIKPVVVFDGVAPELKKKTIQARNQRKQLASNSAKEMRQQLLLSLAKSGAIKAALQNKDSVQPVAEPNKPKRGKVQNGMEEDLYNLPPMPASAITPEEEHDSEDSWGSDEDDNLMSYCETKECIDKDEASSIKGNVGGGWKKWSRWIDPHEVDVQDENFKALPVEVRREILTDLKEARKESSWGRLHKMPKKLDNFSSFQMSRLLHRRKVQEVWEDVEKELSKTEMKGASLGELEVILAEKGVDVASGLGQITQRIASDENKGFILLSGLKGQNTDEEAGEKKNFDISPLSSGAGINQGKLSEGETNKWVKKKQDRRESLNEPTLTESKMLNENDKLKDFIKVAVETSEGTELYEGDIFKNTVNSYTDVNLQGDILQKEIMALIKEYPGRNLTDDTQEDKNEVQCTVDNQRKNLREDEYADPVLSSVEDQGRENSFFAQKKIEVMMHDQIKMLESEKKISSYMNFDPNGSNFSEVEGVFRDTKVVDKLSSAEVKEPCQVLLEKNLDLSSKEEPLQSKIMSMLTNHPIKNITKYEMLKQSEDETLIQMTSNKSELINEDLKDESVDLVEVMKVQEMENEGLTQEEILAIINNIPTKPNNVKANDTNADIRSESDESDFVEVEEVLEEMQMDDKLCNSDLKELCEHVTERNVVLGSKTAKNKNLEVVLNLDENSGEGNDIFADVFESNSLDKNILSIHQEPLKEQTHLEKCNIRENIYDGTTELSKVTNVSENTKGIHMPENKSEKQLRDDKMPVYMVEQMEEERHCLTLEMRKREREANAGVTEKVRLELQELLSLFGVPWVVAPFEAEAQCAFLESASPKTSILVSTSSVNKFLAEGTVTEDSDVWAFGASTVYRHVFDRRRTRVRLFSKEEIQKKFGLTRYAFILLRVQVVQLALLTGSDYTIGLPGVGTVTALEILAAFPGEKNPCASSTSDIDVDDVLSGLRHFADWWKRVELNEQNGTPIGHSYFDPSPAVSQTLKRRLRACWKAASSKQLGTSLLPPGFPSLTVVQAYLKPYVDECRDIFTWLKPDEAALRSYAQLHFGWTNERTDSILRPLFARLKLSDNKDRTQTTLHSYFSHIRTSFLPIDLECSNIGIRAQKALEKIAGKCEELSLPQNERVNKATSEKELHGEQEKSGEKDAKVIIKQSNKTGNINAIKSGSRARQQLVKQTLGELNPSSMENASVKETGFSSSLYSSDKIPQREKECANALQSKLKAIEVLRKSSMGAGKRAGKDQHKRFPKKKIKRTEVLLSESSDDSD